MARIQFSLSQTALTVVLVFSSGCSGESVDSVAPLAIAAPSPPAPPPAAPPPPPPPPPTASASSVTWSEFFGETAPTDRLTLPRGTTVTLDDCDTAFEAIKVEGGLVVDSLVASQCDTAHMEAAIVHIMGPEAFLEIGTPEAPFAGKFELTLTGDLEGEGLCIAEQRSLMLMLGGELRTFGASAEKRPWTRLTQTVRRGETVIALAEPTGWEVGDEIVIASSNIDPREAERAIIQDISADGLTVTLDDMLDFDHFGEELTYGGKSIDMRAEVGLLTHNIVIQGDEGSYDDAIGGHIMVMNEELARPGDVNDLNRPAYEGKVSFATVEGVELRRLGQRGRAGRYSFHWHLVGDGSGQHIRNSSVHDGFQRAVNVHGTDATLVEGVVGYDVANHMFVPSEEGDEVRNVFRANLDILSRRVAREHFAFPSEASGGARSAQSEQRASVFWLRNTFNTLHDNVAAGALQGQGYMYDPAGFNRIHARLAFEETDWESFGDSLEVCDFVGNTAHSLYTGIGSPGLYTPAVKGYGIFMSARGYRVRRAGPDGEDLFTTCTFKDFEAYKTQLGGAWLEEDTILTDAIITDSYTGVTAGDILADVVVVGQSENNLQAFNTNNVSAAPGLTLGGFVQSNNGGQKVAGRRFDGLTCIGLPACFNSMVNSNDRINQFNGASIDNVTLIDTPEGFVSGRVLNWSLQPDMEFELGDFTDIDGALTGIAGYEGDMDEGVFQTNKVRQDSQFGWSWTSLRQAPSE